MPLLTSYQDGFFVRIGMADATLSFYDTGSGSPVTYTCGTSGGGSFNWAVFILKR
jgi:hypothetical protein